ncbi:uncharacterized protein LOC109724149 [Ananas comosus]|uniref:Uncharacterized protein LOC109724149 n=1 Tax=Ananas comosus TaxID=4615 RepID=A0A6P5GKF2_ANACO|nr:uncharacterized protein LOC109724149 [Ananas comosus]
MASLTLKHFVFVVALFCMANFSCKAQDPVQIVARAALCFDNHTVTLACLDAMGIHLNGTKKNSTKSGSMGELVPSKKNSTANATSILCNTPCFGQMMLVMNCVDGILSNFQGYNSGLMQGVRAIFQMSCGIGNNGTAAAPTAPNTGGSLAKSGKKISGDSGNTTAATNNANGVLLPSYMWIALMLFNTALVLWCY